MGLADAFGAEDRVQVKFSDFYELVKGCTQRDQMLNAINCNVPHRYIREMVTGKSEEPEERMILYRISRKQESFLALRLKLWRLIEDSLRRSRKSLRRSLRKMLRLVGL